MAQKSKILTIITIMSICFDSFLFAQNDKEKIASNPPVVFEALAGRGGAAYQLVINKKFKNSKAGFSSTTNISSKWNEAISFEAMNQANLTFEFVKDFNILGGVHYTPVTGLRPTVALMYSKVTESISISVAPRIIFADKTNIEGFGMFEYTPRINEQWRGYVRLQGIYGQSISNGIHSRSYLMARAGARYHSFDFGIGANWDVFGPEKSSKQNYGLFLAARLFN